MSLFLMKMNFVLSKAFFSQLLVFYCFQTGVNDLNHLQSFITNPFILSALTFCWKQFCITHTLFTSKSAGERVSKSNLPITYDIHIRLDTVIWVSMFTD